MIAGSYNRLMAFPAEARSRAGFQLNQVQQGRMPDDWKPMSSTIGAGVVEIRLHVPQSTGLFTQRALEMQYTCCMHSRRRHRKLQIKI